MVLLLQAKLGNGQVNHSMFIGVQAVPLDRDVEGRHATRKPHTCPKVVGLAVGDFLEMAYGRQHGEHGFYQHARVPRAARADLQVRWVIRTPAAVYFPLNSPAISFRPVLWYDRGTPRKARRTGRLACSSRLSFLGLEKGQPHLS